jgi:hypothetical protein
MSISVNTAALAYHPKKWEDFVEKWSKRKGLSDRKIRQAMVEAALLSDFHTGPQLCFSQERVTRAVRTKSINLNRVHIWVGISMDPAAKRGADSREGGDSGGGYRFLVNGMRSSPESGTPPKLFYRLTTPKLAADKSLGLIHSQLAELQEELMESQKELDASSSDSDESSSE